MKKTTLAIYSTLLLATSPLIFADSQLATQNPHFGEKGWDVEAVVGLVSVSDLIYKSEDDDKNSLLLGINATYYGEDFYFVADDDEGLLLGYNLNKSDQSALDVILAPRFSGFDPEDDLLKDLDERKTDLHAGLRYTQYMGDSVYKFEVSKDISDRHDGFILGALYEKEWQHKNWLITGGASAAYISEKMTDYYFGVDADEATTTFTTHNAEETVLIGLSLKAEYPINENWVASGTINHLMSDGNVADSPITEDNDHITAVSAAIKYHF